MPDTAVDLDALIQQAAHDALSPWGDPDDDGALDSMADQVRDAVLVALIDWHYLIVPESFVTSVLYSGAFEGEDLQKLYAEAQRLLDGPEATGHE